MSPVHVIVGDDPRAEQMWSTAFTGAVDLYRFDRNVDAFERLTAAQAPVDLVVLTPAQSGPFNLTPDQFVARVLEGPLASSSTLANLHVIVVGSPLTRSHPRAMAVSTLDAAIRLVKFGEVESAPRPIEVPVASAAPSPRVDGANDVLADLPFSGSVISRIWSAGDEAPAAPQAPAEPAQVAEVARDAAGADEVAGGGPAAGMQARQAPQAPAQLFSRAAPAGFVVAGGGAAAAAPAPAAEPQVGAPGEAIEVATGALEAARPYQLPGGGAYRGPAVRGGAIQASGYHQHDGGGQPVPPALASQVETMVYGSMQVGNPHDPVMVWSSAARGEATPTPESIPAPVPMGIAAAPVAPGPVMVAGAQPAAPRVVPLEPPVGAYQGVAPAAGIPQQPAMSPQAANDPFLQRAEAGGGDVSFG